MLTLKCVACFSLVTCAGLYDVDHTSKPMERREGKTKRRAKSAPDDKKDKGKGKAGGGLGVTGYANAVCLH